MKSILAMAFLGLWLLVAAGHARPGDSRDFGVMRDWNVLNNMVALNGRLYVARTGDLLVVDANGKGTPLPIKGVQRWGRTYKMAVLSGRIYCINEEILYEVEPSGRAKQLSSDWLSVRGMAALSGKLYIVDSEKLYEVEPSTGEYKELSEGWYNVDGVVVLDGKLYILRRDTLNEVDLRGNAKELSVTWNDAKMVAADGKLYIASYVRTQPGDKLINEHILESFEPRSGTRTRLMPPKGWDRGTGVTAMSVLNGRLYLFQTARFFSLALK